MVLPTVTELPFPLQRIEHDAFADALPLREIEPRTATIIVLPLPDRRRLDVAA